MSRVEGVGFSLGSSEECWFTMYHEDGTCCLAGWPRFSLSSLVDEVCQRAQQVQPADDGPPDDRPTLDDVPRGILSLPAHFRPGCGRFWHEGCNGKANPRAIKKMPSRPPNVRIGRDEPPRQLTHGRTHEPLRPPSPLVELEMPLMAPRVPSKPLRGCVVLPSMVLPETYNISPDYSRAYCLGFRVIQKPWVFIRAP